MSGQKSRFGNYGGSSSSSRKKVCVTYTIRQKDEPRNRSGVNRIRVDPVGKRLYTAGRDSIIRCWDLEDLAASEGQCDNIMSMEHHTDWVNDIIVCKEGRTLMSASSDTSLKIWDTSRGTCTSTLKPHKDYIQALAYAPATEIAVSASLDHGLFLWDINSLTSLTTTKNTVTTIPLKGQKESIYSVDINYSGTVIVSGSTEKALKLWDTRTYQKLMKLKGHTDNVRTVLLNRDGTECLSGSSDGTIRLWSLGQQRCVETFRMHEGGVWTLAVDDNFRYFYSSGKDKRVFVTDIAEGNQEGVLLFTEDKPVLSLTLDTIDKTNSLWVATSGTAVKKWPASPREYTSEDDIVEGDISDEEEPGITDIDEINHVYDKPLLTIPGGTTIVECRILNSKRQVLTKDNTGNVALWNVLQACHEVDLGHVDIDIETNKRREPLFVPNWFSCDVKTGMLGIKLEENDCYSAWVMGNNTDLPNTADLKLNLGALVLKALFEHWPESHIYKEEQKLAEEKSKEPVDTVKLELFMSIVENIEDSLKLGQALGLTDEVIKSLLKETTNDKKGSVYEKMYKYFNDDHLTTDKLANALHSINREDLVSKLTAELDDQKQSKADSPNKVANKFFTVPNHTPIVLSEATDCGATLARFTCEEACKPHENNVLRTYCPLWVSDIVCQNQLPNHPKMSFTLSKMSDVPSKDTKSDRLSAQDILTVKKVIDYLYGKLYGDKGPVDSNDIKIDPLECLELFCQGQALDPSLNIRTVKHTIWKSSGDMKLQYKIKDITTPTGTGTESLEETAPPPSSK